MNDQLRQINAALRRQAKIESYAPTLSYAPVSRVSEADVVVDPRKEQLLASLRTGKNFLRNQEPDKAFAEFKAAFELAQTLGDHIDEKKAARGLGSILVTLPFLHLFSALPPFLFRDQIRVLIWVHPWRITMKELGSKWVRRRRRSANFF